MTLKGLALATACALMISACGGVARPESRSIGSDPIVTESPAASSEVTQTSLVDAPPPTTVPVTPSAPVESAEPATSVDDSPTSTTTSPVEAIDLAEVRDALDALDALFGDLDGQIGSVDLDEGETP